MATAFHLTVLTPERAVLETDVTYLEAPGLEGYLGVLANHAPLITVLVPGRIRVRDLAGVQADYAVSGGFLEVSQNAAVILADAVEGIAAIDRERAASAAERARERLSAALRDPSIDVQRAHAALARSMNRQRLCRR
jgi:F-type H+-transporting ATPase subunit epsilon